MRVMQQNKRLKPSVTQEKKRMKLRVMQRVIQIVFILNQPQPMQMGKCVLAK